MAVIGVLAALLMPSLSTAKERARRAGCVLQYFELCRKFWNAGAARLDQWSKDVKAGNMPDFGANLSC